MKKRIIVCGIICKSDEVLLGKKEKGRPPYPDVWHTMGGGINNTKKGIELIKEKKYNDPYFHKELRREIIEEANISLKNIENICPKYRKDPRKAVAKNKHNEDTQYIFLEYLCELDDGVATPGDDIAEVKWVAKNKLKNVPLTPPSKEMYKELNWL